VDNDVGKEDGTKIHENLLDLFQNAIKTKSRLWTIQWLQGKAGNENLQLKQGELKIMKKKLFRFR
jgi:hypothetical protein